LELIAAVMRLVARSGDAARSLPVRGTAGLAHPVAMSISKSAAESARNPVIPPPGVVILAPL
jgi:hypothetical protein